MDTSKRRRSSTGFTAMPLKSDDPSAKLVEQMTTSLRRREIVGSLNVAVATAFLLHTVTKNASYSTIDELLGITKAIGRQLTDANPKGNIVRRVLRLIREEYRAAAQAHASAPSSAPETPFFGPTTPGLQIPSTHYLSNDLSFPTPPGPKTPGARSPPPPPSGTLSAFDRPALPHAQTSLSNFVVMRHSRAQNQLERTGSLIDRNTVGGVGFNLAGLTMSPGPSSSALPTTDLSSSTGSLFNSPRHGSPSRGNSTENMYSHGNGYASPPGKMDSEEFMRQSARLKPVLLQAIEEVISELETTREDVARTAKEHIHSSEVILTIGHSKTVEAFLRQAARDRKFTVIVAESAPTYSGRDLAESLAASNIPTLLVPDSSLLALIPRITKVILGCHSVLANGGFFAISGTLATVLAARSHAKPIMIVTGQFKFGPVWNTSQEWGAVDYQSPIALMCNNAAAAASGAEDGVEMEMPYWEYIKPELVDLFVTNEGDHAPAYIYRLIKEAYDEEDVDL